MTFTDLMNALDYTLHLREGNSFSLIKTDEQNIAQIVLIFDKIEKTIRGFIKVTELLNSIDDMAHIYALFRQMKKDMKEFAELIHYERIY